MFGESSAAAARMIEMFGINGCGKAGGEEEIKHYNKMLIYFRPLALQVLLKTD